MENHIRANAELVIEQLRPLSRNDFGYNAESVAWLEGYIERLRQSDRFETEADQKKFASIFGSFLGECIVRCYGGAWTQRDGDWCVAFSEDNIAFPFAKVRKQMKNGLEDGIGSFFCAIPQVFAEHVRLPPEPSRKRWWKF